jgi:hypothetical protein
MYLNPNPLTARHAKDCAKVAKNNNIFFFACFAFLSFAPFAVNGFLLNSI